MSPNLVFLTDTTKYAESVAPFLEANEVENGLFLGILDLAKAEPLPSPPVMVQITDGEKTIAAAFQRDRYLLVTSGLEEAAEDIATQLRNRGVELPGVAGPSSSAERFAKAWARIRGCESNLTVDQGLYSLKTLNWPEPIKGKMRPMTTHDIPVVAQWILAFQREAVPFEAGSWEDAYKNAVARPPRNMTFIWEVDGAPVAMAALARPSKHGITLNAVFTPPAFRRRGYAKALVAFLTDEGLKRGKEFCCLYTDLANPTSNSIYQTLGYRLCSYARVYLFG